jgi:hypothetical protein
MTIMPKHGEIDLTVDPADYAPMQKPQTGDPLHQPSHSGLHNRTGTQVQRLNERVTVVETHMNDAWDAVEGARLASHQWIVPGSLFDVPTLQLLMPIVWNGTDHQILYSAAKASIFDAADRDIKVMIYNGTTLDGGGLNKEITSPVLSRSLIIPAGQLTSPTFVQPNDFVANAFHGPGSWVAAVIEQVGTEDMPGADLMIQLDRLL